MATSRKLIKSNSKGFHSETTEKNERLRIWLTFLSGALSALLGFFYTN
jgi:hypothetical protein